MSPDGAEEKKKKKPNRSRHDRDDNPKQPREAALEGSPQVARRVRDACGSQEAENRQYREKSRGARRATCPPERRADEYHQLGWPERWQAEAASVAQRKERARKERQSVPGSVPSLCE
ncbi:MAG: hypothetical protein AMXMBFR58_39010 [Phycisphaerae bacterium]